MAGVESVFAGASVGSDAFVVVGEVDDAVF